MRSQYRRACPSARWPARWHQCGSQTEPSYETGTALGIRGRPLDRDSLRPEGWLDDHQRFSLSFGLDFQRNESWQVSAMPVAEQRQPSTNHIGVDAVAHRNSGHGNTGLLALLDDLGLERFRVGLTLAHGDPDGKGNC